jgi:hypothetical protein
MAFDPRYQTSQDGPLTPQLRERINSFRPEATLADIGKTLGFSGAFISQLLSEKNPSRVRTLHMPRIIKALEFAERERDMLNSPTKTAKPEPTNPVPTAMTLEDHMRAIDALGFTVTVTPKTK